jgi:hypothetical protein
MPAFTGVLLLVAIAPAIAYILLQIGILWVLLLLMNRYTVPFAKLLFISSCLMIVHRFAESILPFLAPDAIRAGSLIWLFTVNALGFVAYLLAFAAVLWAAVTIKRGPAMCKTPYSQSEATT